VLTRGLSEFIGILNHQESLVGIIIGKTNPKKIEKKRNEKQERKKEGKKERKKERMNLSKKKTFITMFILIYVSTIL